MTTPIVAIVGLGNIGSALASDFVKSDRHFLAANKSLEKATEIAAKWGALATPRDIATATREANIIILAIPFAGIVPYMQQYAAQLEGKIIIDPSNPFRLDKTTMKFSKIIPANESAGVTNAKALPKNAKLVKTFGSLGAVNLSGLAFQTPERAVMFYANDDTSVNDAIEQLIKDSGFDPLRVGGLDKSIRIEIYGDLHQTQPDSFGKPMTLASAKAKL